MAALVRGPALPMRRGRAFVVAVAAFLGLAASCSLGSNEDRTAPSTADWTTPPAAAWPTNGGDWFNRRYSPLTQITRQNVGSLKAVWRTRLGSGLSDVYSGEAQPLLADGVLYVVTGADDVFAVDVESGAIRWRYAANLNPAINSVCCGWTSRGVALGGGRVYVAQLDGKLVALDQATGAVVWSTQATRWQDGFTLTSAPLFYDGLVITGMAGAEYGVRGKVSAFRAEDGSPAWTFYTIPGPGEIGHETWPADNDSWTRGGGSVWQTPAVDPKLGLIYFATGNAGPDFNGSQREGDNLFTASIVAVDARTGRYRWHFQEVHHDIWDFDAPNPVVLFNVDVGGRQRRALAHAGKTGWVYILDRVTGKPLLPIPERRVPQEPRQRTSATQPTPVGDAFVPQEITDPTATEGLPLVNRGRIFTPFWKEYLASSPGSGGGANWPPSAYDPISHNLYICATERISVFRGGEEIDDLKAGQHALGGQFGSLASSVRGALVAMDMRTNRVTWRQAWPDRCYSGLAATAGGLLFVGRNDGRFTAVDSATGKILWVFQTGAGVNAPPSVFEHRGKQYVAVLSAGSKFVASPRGDSLWLFALHGTMGPVPAAQISRAAMSGPASPIKGRDVFARNCSMCHGADANGGAGGPDLTRIGDALAVSQIVTHGRDQMPAFGSQLSAAEIRDVSAYVAQLSGH